MSAQRLWRHTELDDGRQQETADDTSKAFQGRTVGIAVQWRVLASVCMSVH